MALSKNKKTLFFVVLGVIAAVVAAYYFIPQVKTFVNDLFGKLTKKKPVSYQV